MTAGRYPLPWVLSSLARQRFRLRDERIGLWGADDAAPTYVNVLQAVKEIGPVHGELPALHLGVPAGPGRKPPKVPQGSRFGWSLFAPSGHGTAHRNRKWFCARVDADGGITFDGGNDAEPLAVNADDIVTFQGLKHERQGLFSCQAEMREFLRTTGPSSDTQIARLVVQISLRWRVPASHSHANWPCRCNWR